MTNTLHTRAEIAKLARLLGRAPEELAYLEAVAPEDLRQLRDQATDVLFSTGGALERLASASKLLPVGLVATMAERAFGPVLSARVAGLLDPDRAVQMASKLPTDFLADIACELDPRRADAVIARIPPQQIAAITRVLVGRGEYVTMGRFVGHLSGPAIAAAVKAMDDRALLHIAAVIENPESLPDLIGLLPAGRLEHVVDTAAADALWPEALELVRHLAEDQRREVIQIAAGRDDAVLGALVAAADRERLWDAVLPLIGLMSDDSLKRFAALPALREPGVLEAIVEMAAEQPALWGDIVPIVAYLPEDCQARIAEHVVALPVDTELLLARAREAGVADRLGPLSTALSAAGPA